MLILITDNIPQWVALGLGVYVTVSWVQALKARDPATHAMMFKAKGLIYTLLAFPSIAFVTYGIGYWTAPLLLRLHDTSPAEVGMYIGLGSAAGGLIGVTLGGIIGDWAKVKTSSRSIDCGLSGDFRYCTTRLLDGLHGKLDVGLCAQLSASFV